MYNPQFKQISFKLAARVSNEPQPCRLAAAHARAHVGFTLLFCRRWRYMRRYALIKRSHWRRKVSYKSDIEIARGASKALIQDIGAKIGIESKDLLPYGHDTGF